ncbi:MAG: acetyltransferase [Anaerorhabdus sp.]|nr:acetyltransferase [Erysipelotrichales bacterium]
MNKKVILIGNGVHAKVVADIILLNNDEIVGFIVEEKYGTDNILGLQWLGDFSAIEKYRQTCEFILAMGDNLIRKKIADCYKLSWYTAIHPRAVVDTTSKIGVGSCIMANAVINSCALIGEHCILNTGSIVEHDCQVGNYCHLSPNSTLCGSVQLGSLVHVGAGATIINNILVSSEVILGAGSCVIHNIKESGTYVGVPVKKLIKC